MRDILFRPKILTTLRGYTRGQFLGDALAGLTVGLVALPLAIAFGIASIPESVAAEAGLSPPVMGLFTAVVAGFLISALGGSRVSIGGPTGAFVVIVYAVAAEYGYAGLVWSTILAGVFLTVMGLARLGGMIKYIPYPVTTGFTSGIAVIILAGQVKDLLGLTGAAGDSQPPEFLGKVRWCAAHIGSIDWPTALLGLGSVAALVLWRRFGPKRVPGPIVVMLAATVLVQALGLARPTAPDSDGTSPTAVVATAGADGAPGAGPTVETIGSRFGRIPSGLPAPKAPRLEWDRLPDLIQPALTIALLAAIESLLCAVVADGMLGTRHRSNTELIAQGVANIAAPLFGGIPATGAIARTATNVQSGGRTPVAGIVHALTLLAVILAVGRYASLVPLASLAAVLVVVAWNMSEAHRFLWILKGPRSDAAVLLVTFSLTVLTDLTIAVQVGMVLAAILFIKRMADVTNVESIRTGLRDERDANGGGLETPPGVEVYRINGPFFFGAAYKLRETLDQIGDKPRVLILDLSEVPAIDATGLHALDELRARSARDGARVILAGAHAQPVAALARTGALSRFGEENLAGTVEEAIGLVRAPSGG